MGVDINEGGREEKCELERHLRYSIYSLYITAL